MAEKRVERIAVAFIIGSLWALSLVWVATHAMESSINAQRQATDNASYWQREAERCYRTIAPAVYLTDRGYRILGSFLRRRVVIEVPEVQP